MGETFTHANTQHFELDSLAFSSSSAEVNEGCHFQFRGKWRSFPTNKLKGMFFKSESHPTGNVAGKEAPQEARAIIGKFWGTGAVIFNPILSERIRMFA